jgi:eukaryotic-like serine/threonine-protein kinase
MGQVWAARDELLGRDVAVKEMLPPRGMAARDLDELRERTMREARAIARLTHRNVVRVIDVVLDDDLPCIVMELVPSRSLDEAIRNEGPMAPARVARIGLDVLAALRVAHREGLLHRDVKPANVLLADDGRAVLTDFGLVSIAGDSSMTATGIVLGSPSYLAPELALGAEAGPASDLWSFGATLYMAVEGSPPYSKSTPMATLAAVATELPRAPKRPGVLRDVLEGLLRRDPAQRIDAGTAERLLRVAAGDEPPSTGRPAAGDTATVERVPGSVAGRRGRALLLLGGMAALLAAGVLISQLVLPHSGAASTAVDAAPPPASPMTTSAPAVAASEPTASPSPTPRRPSPTTAPKRSTTTNATVAAAHNDAGNEDTTNVSGREFTVVSFQSHANNRYVAADDGGTSPLLAYPDAIGPWETWDEIDLGNGDIALRAEINEKYVTADSAGTQPLIADQDSVGRSETFHLVHNADGSVSFLARANSKYVTAAEAGAKPLINNRATIGESEKFDRIVR